MTTRKLPYDKDAEQSVLGAVMMDDEAAVKVFAKTTISKIFYMPVNQVIFNSMISLFNEGKPIDQITVSDHLKRLGKLKEVGGSYYVTGLLEAIPGPSRVLHHLDIVIQKWGLRELIKEGTITAKEAYDNSKTVEEILEGFEARLLTLNDKLQGEEETVLIADVIHEVSEKIDAANAKALKSGVFGYSTGFPVLDSLTYGIETEYTIIAGRPSMGKTSLAFAIAYNVANIEKVPTYIISLEMTRDAAIERMAYALGGTSRIKLLENPEEESEKLNRGLKMLSEVPIYIDQVSTLNNIELRSRVRKNVIKHNVKLVIIDYLQLMEVSSSDNGRWNGNRTEEIRQISKSIANLKKETGLSFIVLSQLSRKSEERKDKRPMMSDLRDSGAIEQDADKILLMYRPDYWRTPEKSEELINKGQQVLVDECLVNIAKHRSGPTGTVGLKFNKEYARFENWSEEEKEQLRKLKGNS